MIKLENGNKSQILLKSESPALLFYSSLLIYMGTFSYMFTGGMFLVIAGIVLLLISAWNSRKEKNFKEFYKLPVLIVLLETVILVVFLILFLVADDFGLVMFGIYLDIETLISIYLVLTLAIMIMLVLSLIYCNMIGRRKELGRYISEGYEITNLKELDKKELKLVCKVKATTFDQLNY